MSPLVLNMASDYRPGGGVSSGRLHKRRELFRRTNYFRCISDQDYPLYDKVILTKNVWVIKDRKYKIIKQSDAFSADFLACPGIRRPELDFDQVTGAKKYGDRKEEESMRMRIRSIFVLAAVMGYKSLVLGALGCGAFRNPIPAVVAIFKKEIKRFGRVL